MPLFPSKEWCEAVVRVANADPEAEQAGRGWKGDFGAVVDPEPGALTKPFVIHCVPVGGKIERLKVLSDPDDLDEIEPAYLVRAPYSVWKGLLLKTLDPIDVLIKKQVSLKGDLQPLMERMKFRHLADRILAQVPTRFIDDDKKREG